MFTEIFSKHLERMCDRWAIENPVKTNRDIMTDTFGINWSDNFPMSSRLSEWLDQEYEKPKDDPQRICLTCKYAHPGEEIQCIYDLQCKGHDKWEAKDDNQRNA